MIDLILRSACSQNHQGLFDKHHFFGFLFQGLSSNASTAMQSLLALVGAISLQSGAKQDAHKVREGMRRRMEVILGDGFDKRLKDQQQNEPSFHQKYEKQYAQQQWEGKLTRVRRYSSHGRSRHLRETLYSLHYSMEDAKFIHYFGEGEILHTQEICA